MTDKELFELNIIEPDMDMIYDILGLHKSEEKA